MGIMADSRLEEMEYISESFLNNSVIKDLLREPMTDENILSLHTEMEKINSVNTARGYFITLCGVNGQMYMNWETDGMIYRNSLIDRIKSFSWYEKLEASRSLPIWLTCMDNVAGYEYSGKVITLVRNIMNDRLGEEEILGFVIISIPSRQASEFLLDSTEQVVVVDSNKTIVMSQNAEEIGNRLEEVSLEKEKMQRITVNGISGFCRVRANQQGDLYTVVFVRMGDILNDILVLTVVIGLAVGLSVVVIFAAAHRVSQSLASPILELERSMLQVQEGKLSQAELQTGISEIRSLADNFNLMVERIRILIEEKIKEEQKRKEIEVEKANAELKFLRAQINPHFLFNTLNSIKWLALLHGARPVEEMITALGRLLECSMQRGNDFIPLKEEVENVKAYLRIQQMRYGSRVRAEYDVEETACSSLVPKLILQPLVENAIIHGTEQNANGGVITIRIWQKSENIIMEVEDDGPGLPENFDVTSDEAGVGKEHRFGGIGVYNIDRRLKLIYGGNYGLHYEKGQNGKGTIAVLVVKKEEHHVESVAGR